MRRVLRLIVIPIALAGGVVSLGVACDDGTSGCRVDTDCPTGNICRGSICGLANPEAGVADADFSPLDSGGSCSNEGIACTQSTDCCAGICTEGRCATSATSSPLCKGLLEICQNDCCAGYTCTNGACR